jgi:dTDP-4-dehydrorhamnose 3,5-epimerase
MNKIETKINGAFIIKPVFHSDDRGDFYTPFNRESYTKLGIIHLNIAQMNTSISHKNVLRGLHYQSGLNAQSKLVWVTSGEVLDVFVDLREHSPTYGQWDSISLIANGNRLFIPKGCAHGFLSLDNKTEFNYFCSNDWNKDSERCLIWNDTDLNINWGITNPIISQKDSEGLSFKDCEKYNDEYR